MSSISSTEAVTAVSHSASGRDCAIKDVGPDFEAPDDQ